MEPERKTWQAWPTPLRPTACHSSQLQPPANSVSIIGPNSTDLTKRETVHMNSQESSSIANTRAAYLGPISPRLQVRDLFPLTPLNQYLCSAYHIQPIVGIFSPLKSAIPEPGRPFPLLSIARSTSLRHRLRMTMFGRQ